MIANSTHNQRELKYPYSYNKRLKLLLFERCFIRLYKQLKCYCSIYIL